MSGIDHYRRVTSSRRKIIMETAMENKATEDLQLDRYLEKRSDLINRMATDSSGVSVIEWYDKEATLYDDQFDNASFQYHKVVVKILNDLIQNKDARILDIAAGTGKLGLLLRERGFTDIDGIDGSKSMSNLAKEKHIYKNYFHHMIGRERIPQIADATYDAASCGGSVAKGHLTFDTIQTMLRTVKPGGYLVFSCAVWNYQFEDFSRERLGLCLQDLKKLGLCSSSEKITSMHREKEPADILILQRGDARLL